MINNFQNLSVFQTALEYAKRGWYCIPLHSIDADGNCTCGKSDCHSPAKHPIASLVPNGLKNATIDVAILRDWFEGKNRNIGIVTGAISGLVVLDVDFKNGGNVADWDDHEKTLINTLKAATGNGEHYFYNYAPLKNSASKLGQGLDIRGDGGYVVAPPSIHANGKTYEFNSVSDVLADFPQEWLDVLNTPNKAANHQANGNGNGSAAGNGLHIPPPNNYQVPNVIGAGGRNDALTSMAGKLHFDGFGIDTIETVLQKENKRLCNPPLDDSEVLRIARSVTRNYQPGVVYTQKVQDTTIQNWDDVQIAKLFLQEFSDHVRFNPEAKKWYLWNGKQWGEDKTNYVIQLAAEFAQNLYSRVSNLVASNAAMKEAMRQIGKTNSSNGLKAVLEIAKAHLSITQSQFDTYPYYINCNNGIVDLKTGQLLPHDPEKYLTKIVHHDFDLNAKTPVFDKFLADVLPDQTIRDFTRRSLGYSLLGVSRERAFWILYGNGNNGKSVFIDAISGILNDYASSTTSSSVMASKGDRIPNDIARLKGKRFVVIPETGEDERINASLIKSLSAGDTITARFLFGEFFDFEFCGKLWIATNHKPRISDFSKGFWDRLKIIPFTQSIPAAQVIKRDDLLAKLFNEGAGIFTSLVRDCLDYQNNQDLGVPQVIQNEIELYKYEQDTIAQFIDEFVEIADGYFTNNSNLYAAYKKFCDENGEFAFSHRRMTLKLKERGFVHRHNGFNRGWEGLKVK